MVNPVSGGSSNSERSTIMVDAVEEEDYPSTSNHGNNGVMTTKEEAKQQQQQQQNEAQQRTNKDHIRVSFREDVIFPPTTPEQPITTTRKGSSSTRSNTSDTESVTSTSSSSQQTPSSKYTKLRSALTREQSNRDPMFYYQVTKNLGDGSMGSVKLVKLRRVGGSARRDIQNAIRRQQLERQCLNIPCLGGIFKYCIDPDNLKTTDNLLTDISSHHSIGSFLNASRSSTKSYVDDRSFEDSLLHKPNNTTDDTEQGQQQIIIYAMKSIHLDLNVKSEYVDELRNEIAILKDLDHPNIVRAIETFEWKGSISIIMELCNGGDLYHRDPYKESEASTIVNQITNAIAYMHSSKVVHRDIKFENILFVSPSTLSWDVKLIDFGLSRIYLNNNQTLTDISGTIYTMAPEVLLNNHTSQADMWSIGVVTFMLLASSLPFYGNDQRQVAKAILENNYKFKGRRWRHVSSEAKKFIKSLLVTDPDQRLDAETALQSDWFLMISSNNNNNKTTTTSRSRRGGGAAPPSTPRAEEEELAKASMIRYSNYPKLKKMALMVVAHKSSSEEIGILRKLFKKYDSQHDGSIHFEDFCNNIMNGGGGGHNYSDEELRQIFEGMDLSGSGTVRYTEFIAATIEAHGAISEARLAEAFDRLDCDDSGFITPENLMNLLGEEVPMEEIYLIIDEADLTKDQRVSYSEFLVLWEDKNVVTPNEEDDENARTLGSELSSISLESEESKAEATDAHAEFLKEKHLQNTLHTWSMEMQLPPHEFALGCSFLHLAALGNMSDLEKMIRERPGLVNFRDYDRRGPLHISASEGHVDVCKYLIKKGARVNRSDRWGGYPLDDAHRHGHSNVVNLLREHGAKFGSTSSTVNLITAASEGNVEEVKTLLEFGSMDLNQGDYDSRTALHLATHEGHLEVVTLLCDAGADVNVKDRWGDRPQDDSKKAKKNGTAILKVLTGAAGIPSFADQQAAANWEAKARMHDLKDQSGKETIASNLDKNQDEEGMTQLPVQEFAMGCSLLHQVALGNMLVLEKTLLERPALVNFKDYDRRTPLHIAASEGQLEACTFLIAKGARINRVDRWGGSPLDDAHRHRYPDVVKFLRDQGAKFGSTSQATNFITAASEGDVEEVQAFLEYGSVDLNKGDYDGRRPLSLAAGEGRIEIVKMLCDAGADVNVEDRWGHRPLDDAISAKTNSADIMKVLLKHGAKSTNVVTNMRAALLSVFA